MADTYGDLYVDFYGDGGSGPIPFTDAYSDTYTDYYGDGGSDSDTYEDTYSDYYGFPAGSGSDVLVTPVFTAAGDIAVVVEAELAVGDPLPIPASGAFLADPELEVAGNVLDVTAVAFTSAAVLAITADAIIEAAGGSDIDVGNIFFASGTNFYAQPVRLRRELGRVLVATPTDEIREALEATQIQVWRVVDILNFDESMWASDVGFLDGSVSVDMTRDERRTLDITLDNSSRDFGPNPNGLWYDKVVRVRRGVQLNGTKYEFDLGYFMIDQITPSGKRRLQTQLTCRDYTKKMLKDKIEAPLSFAKGSFIENVIRALAYNAGITRTAIPATGVELPEALTFDADTSRWEMAKQIATTYGYDLFFSVTGTLMMKTQVDPVTSASVITVGRSARNAISFSPSTNDGELFNHVVCTSSNSSSTLPVWASMENKEPSSPTQVSRIGRRTKRIESALITKKADAELMCRNYLRIAGLEQFDVGFNSLNYPWLDVGNVIELDDPDAEDSDPTRYLLSSLDIPLKVGPMGGGCKRVTIVGNTLVESTDIAEPTDLFWGDEVIV